ncbi:MASE1 domain-containing protein [Streptomyces viridosporus]|uniref:MASE1 domain-containing protein n=1 Tax=Streptomyces viridosporus TaxID=67581 RepID=UPI00142F1CF0
MSRLILPDRPSFPGRRADRFLPSAAALLVATDDLPAHAFRTVRPARWVGDAMGVLIVTPVLLLIRRAHPVLRRSRLAEAAGPAVIEGCAVPPATHHPLGLLFLVHPLPIWAALRFQLAGSMLCALFASVMATVAATRRASPAGDGPGCHGCGRP